MSVDCGVFMNGYYGDHAYTFPIGEVDEATAKLLEDTKASLYAGIREVRAGNRIGDIGLPFKNTLKAADMALFASSLGTV